jgi:hypothetical protein
MAWNNETGESCTSRLRPEGVNHGEALHIIMNEAFVLREQCAMHEHDTSKLLRVKIIPLAFRRNAAYILYECELHFI